VITLDCLDSFDHLIWLRTGARAAEVMGCNQSTISRNSSKCQQIFHVRLRRVAAEWVVVGSTGLLAAERRLHQSYRWDHDLPLRFEAQHWMRDTYAAWQPPGWVKGNLNYLDHARPLDLLKNRIIDAWLCGAPDIPEDPELTCLQLFELPMRLVAQRGHPLLLRRPPLKLEDVAAYPLLPLPESAFPVFQARLAALGLVGPRADAQAERCSSEADGRSFDERCLGIASALTLPLYGPEYQVLSVDIPIHFGDVLVIRSEFAGHRRCQQLINSLLEHLRGVTTGMAELRLLRPDAVGQATVAAQPH